MSYGLGVSWYFLTLGFGSVQFMSSICRPISLDSNPICIILKDILKNLRDITSTMLKNKNCLAFLLEKEYVGEGTDVFNVELMKFDR